MIHMSELFKEIDRNHFPSLCSDESAEVLRFQHRIGRHLPGDMAMFYTYYQSVKLFDKVNPPFYFRPLSIVKSIGEELLSEVGSPQQSWYGFCSIEDGNYVAVDLATVEGESADYIDCFHETVGWPGYQKVISRTFTEFLNMALRSGGRHVWLDEGFLGYGVARWVPK